MAESFRRLSEEPLTYTVKFASTTRPVSELTQQAKDVSGPDGRLDIVIEPDTGKVTATITCYSFSFHVKCTNLFHSLGLQHLDKQPEKCSEQAALSVTF